MNVISIIKSIHNDILENSIQSKANIKKCFEFCGHVRLPPYWKMVHLFWPRNRILQWRIPLLWLHNKMISMSFVRYRSKTSHFNKNLRGVTSGDIYVQGDSWVLKWKILRLSLFSSFLPSFGQRTNAINIKGEHA